MGIDIGIWVTLLLGSMGVTFSGLKLSEWLESEKDTNNALIGFLEYVASFEVPPIGYESTTQFLHQYGDDANAAAKSLVNSLKSATGILTLSKSQWDVWRNLSNAIARGEYTFKTSNIGGGGDVANAKAIFDKFYTNYGSINALENSGGAISVFELAYKLINDGVNVTAFRMQPNTEELQFYPLNPASYPVIVVYPVADDSTNDILQFTSSKNNTIFYKKPLKGVEVYGDLIQAGVLKDSYLTTFDANGNAVKCFVMATYSPDLDFKGTIINSDFDTLIEYINTCREGETNAKFPTTLDIVDGYFTESKTVKIDNVDVPIEYVWSFFVQPPLTYDFAKIELHELLVNGGFEGGAVFTAGSLGDVYEKVNNPTDRGLLGDIITPGRIENNGVIEGPISITRPDSWVETYPGVSDKTNSMSDALAGAGVITGNREEDKTITNEGNKDVTSDITIDGAITDMNNNVNPPTPPVVPPPLIGITSSGFVSLFNPTIGELSELNDVLWSEDFFTNFRKMISDPIDGVISLLAVPIPPETSGRVAVRFGNYESGISMNKVSNQFGSFSCGSIYLSETFGNFLDYAPYTSVCLYLPFIGFVQLNTNEVMNSNIGVNYNIDFLTGACLAQVLIGKHGLNATTYQYSGNMGMQIPVTGSNYSRFYSSIISGAGVVAGALTGGTATVAVAAAGAALNTAVSSGGDVQKSGGISGNSGFLGEFTPYIIVTTPKSNMPDGFNSVKGFISNYKVRLSTLRGFARVSDINLDGIACTASEMAEIETMLKDGVIF